MLTYTVVGQRGINKLVRIDGETVLEFCVRLQVVWPNSFTVPENTTSFFLSQGPTGRVVNSAQNKDRKLKDCGNVLKKFFIKSIEDAHPTLIPEIVGNLERSDCGKPILTFEFPGGAPTRDLPIIEYELYKRLDTSILA